MLARLFPPVFAMSSTLAQSVEPAESGHDDAPPEGWREAGCYATSAEGFEHGLVVLAMGLPYWLGETPEGFRLFVAPEAAEAARGQLAMFDRENAGWPPPRVREAEPAGAAGRFAAGLFVASCWALAEFAAYAAQGRSPELVEAGALDARAVFADGEWWRAATALFLHADAGHLVSNLAGGVFLFATVFALFGRVRGAALLALAATAGNLAAAAIHFPGGYRSIGASTAVFAGLGLLTGRAVRRMASRSAGAVGRRAGWRTMFVPLAAGLTVLGLFGAGDARVDVLAHATGFAAGLLAGFAAGGARVGGEAGEPTRETRSGV